MEGGEKMNEKEVRCPVCQSEDLEWTEGSIVEGVVVVHSGGSPYLVCRRCGEIIKERP